MFISKHRLANKSTVISDDSGDAVTNIVFPYTREKMEKLSASEITSCTSRTSQRRGGKKNKLV